MTDRVRAYLDGIKDQIARATPGPWFVDRGGDFHEPFWQVPSVLRDRYGTNSISSDDRATIELIAAAPSALAVMSDALLAVLALADEADALSRRVWDEMDDYADIGDPKGPYPEGVACVSVDRLRRAVAAHLDPKENPNG